MLVVVAVVASVVVVTLTRLVVVGGEGLTFYLQVNLLIKFK